MRRIYDIKSTIKPVTYIGKVPKVIFKFYDGKVSDSIKYNCDQVLRELNPDFSMIWFTKLSQCESFISKHFDKDVLTAFKTLKPVAFKIDLWRLCILYVYGGVYMDAFVTCFKSIKNIIQESNFKEGEKVFITCLDCSSEYFLDQVIHNGFFISERGHPFLLRTIKDIVKNVQNRYYGITCLSICGPPVLCTSIKKALSIPWYEKIKKGRNEYGKLSFFLLEHRYGPYQSLYQGDELIGKKYYSFLFYIIHKLTDQRYSNMWIDRKVYEDEG